MKPSDGRSHSQRHIFGKWLGLHVIGDSNPVFHACIQNPRNNASLGRSLLTSELIGGVADHLRTQDFQEVGIFAYDDSKGQGRTKPSGQQAKFFGFIHPKHFMERALTAGCFASGNHGNTLSHNYPIFETLHFIGIDTHMLFSMNRHECLGIAGTGSRIAWVTGVKRQQ